MDDELIEDTEALEEESLDAALAEETEGIIPADFIEIARKYKAHESLTDEELDYIADTAISILRNMLGYFGAAEADIDEYDGGEGELILDVSNADLALLIGRHGKTLESFQCMFTLLMNKRLGFRYPVVVDIEGYKNRRRQKLESMARASANKALSRHSEVRMHPMKPYERRIVHLALRGMPGITTHSEGQEPDRYVVVVPNKDRRR